MPREYQKAGAELKETVDEIIAKVERRQTMQIQGAEYRAIAVSSLQQIRGLKAGGEKIYHLTRSPKKQITFFKAPWKP